MEAFRCPECDNPIEPAAFEVDPRCRRCGEPYPGVTSAFEKLGNSAWRERQAAPTAGSRLARGPIRLLLVGLVSLGLLSVTYATPRLQKFRPWSPGQRTPFAQWTGDKAASKKLAGPSFLKRTPPATRTSERTSGEALLASAGPPPGRAEGAGPARGAGEKSPPKGPVSVAPGEFRGIASEIVDPGGKAMDNFYRSLLATAEKKPGALTRISHWGASTMATDGVASTIRRKLQARFGDGGKGWVPITKAWKFIRHKDVVARSRGFKPYHVASRRLGISNYGFGGVVARSSKGAVATYKSTATRLELYYRKMKRGGKMTLSVDGQKPTFISTRANPAVDAWAEVLAEAPGMHRYRVRTLPQFMVQLYGVTLENQGPGVVYDNIALVGTFSSRLAHYIPSHIKGQVAHRKPDLMVFMFGGNELSHRKINLKRYLRDYRKVLRLMRAGRPDASCLIMTPADHGMMVDGEMVTDPLLLKIVDLQRSLASTEKCAFFNTIEAMGGAGAAKKWHGATPRLISGDFAHLTEPGEKAFGNLLYKAYMKGFSDWLARRAR